MNVIDARRYVKVGQAAAVALGLSAATLWAVDVPGLGKKLPAQPVVKPAQTDAPRQAPASAKQLGRDELAAMAGRLEIGANVKKPEVKEEVAKTEPKPETPVTAWTYLGPIQEPDRLLALISVDGHQKVLAEGRKYGETRLVSVEPDEIVTEDSGGRHHVSKAERGERRVAWLTNMPASAPPGIGGVGQPGQGGGMSPEVRQRMIDRGINPDRAGRWQQRMNERNGRGGGPGGGGGGPGGGPGNGFNAGALVPGPSGMNNASGDVGGVNASTVKVVGPNGETVVKMMDASGATRTVTLPPTKGAN